MLDHDEVIRLYGPWKQRTPQDAVLRFAEYDGPWWISGGWAIDAFVGSRRAHGDLDIGIPRATADRFIDFASSGSDVWAAAGTLTPMRPGQHSELPDRCGNLWLRAGGADPWEYDVLLESAQGETWVCQRDERITRPLADCLWKQDAITYLRPEVQLLLKAKNVRAKDAFDLERCLPLLNGTSLRWLEESLQIAHPGHPWIDRVAGV